MGAPPVNYRKFLEPRYKPGDVVMSTLPYAYIIWSSERGRCCDHCTEPAPAAATGSSVSGSLERCNSCETDFYCGPECRRAALASFHRFECPLLAAWRLGTGESVVALPDMTRLLFRVLTRRHFDRQSEALAATGSNEPHFPEVDDPGWKRTFEDLLSHEDKIKAQPETYLNVVNALYTFCERGASLEFPLPPRSEIIATFGRIRTNWFDICDQDLRYVGAAIHFSPALMNHSCTQNCLFVTNGLRQEWRVARHIDTTVGEQMFLDYVLFNDLTAMAERKPYFRNMYFFDCTCPFCDGSETALRRDRRLTSLRCVNGDECRKMAECDYCWTGSADVSDTDRADAEGEARRAIDAMREEEARSDHAAAADLAARYLDGEQRLGVCNVLVVRVREAMVRACLELSQSVPSDGSDRKSLEEASGSDWLRLQRGVAEGLVLLDVYRLLYHSPAWRVGKLSYDVGLLLMRIGCHEEAVPLIAEALDLLRVTHGRNHGIVCKAERHLAACSAVGEARKQ